MFHVAGFGFGDCIKMLAEYADIDVCALVDQLNQLKNARNTLVHRMFSGRTDLDHELREGLAAGADAWASLRRLLEKYDAASPS